MCECVQYFVFIVLKLQHMLIGFQHLGVHAVKWQKPSHITKGCYIDISVLGAGLMYGKL